MLIVLTGQQWTTRRVRLAAECLRTTYLPSSLTVSLPFPHSNVFFPFFSSFFLSPSFSCNIGQQHQKCFNRALMAPASPPPHPPTSPSIRTYSNTCRRTQTRARRWLEIACPVVGGGKVSRQEKKSGRQEERRDGLVLLMEDDMPSFSHPQLPSSSFQLIV